MGINHPAAEWAALMFLESVSLEQYVSFNRMVSFCIVF